jgi:hypothetical protein
VAASSADTACALGTAEATGIGRDAAIIRTLSYAHRLALGRSDATAGRAQTAPPRPTVIAVNAPRSFLDSVPLRHHQPGGRSSQSPVATDIGVVFPVAHAVVIDPPVDGLAGRVKGRWDWVDVQKARRDWDRKGKLLNMDASDSSARRGACHAQAGPDG